MKWNENETINNIAIESYNAIKCIQRMLQWIIMFQIEDPMHQLEAA